MSLTAPEVPGPAAPVVDYATPPPPKLGLLGLTGAQWRSGIAAWLGWLFDGLDMHLYTLVAAPFVAELLQAPEASNEVREKGAWIMAAFLVGWAIGGGFFGRIGDLLGRSKALALTILTYAAFTGLGAVAQTWWQLMIFRFLAALGIGGEWAIGSSLLSETWPPRWRVWVAAVLQTAVNIGVLLACVTNYALSSHYRAVFLVGALPAVMVYWIRRHVPEPHEWRAAKAAAKAQAALLGKESGGRGAAGAQPGIADLFRGSVRRITVLTIIVCACSLTAWWVFMYWHVQHLRRVLELAGWSVGDRSKLTSAMFFLVIGVSIAGNFFAAAVARWLGYRRSIAVMCLGFFGAICGAYCVPRGYQELFFWLPLVGFFSGVFGLFTMYLPPLFPTLLRTTGAGFSYNIGRIAAAAGTIVFAMAAKGWGEGDLRKVLLADGFLFIPAMFVALLLPELKDRNPDRQAA
jgi:MFS family permease